MGKDILNYYSFVNRI